MLLPVILLKANKLFIDGYNIAVGPCLSIVVLYKSVD